MIHRALIKKAILEGRVKLLEHESINLLESYGIPVAKAELASEVNEAVALAKKIGYPVVLKIVSPDISHKSDVGGVRVGIDSDDGVRSAFNEIISNVSERAPGSRIAGVLVQKMAPSGGIEVIIGGLRDRAFGPVIMFGLGGVFVEVLRDVSFRISPLLEEEAYEMLRELKGARVLNGYRGMPPVDKSSLVRIILKVAKILDENPEIDSLDLNPVMSYTSGALVVDARVILRSMG
ncbi:MAG: acetate--CoA ligase family protein [Sulfolobales archaeon]|nr:acetate--CoA ligase family protein [Sulfolobales archaeon]MCX8199597.1 acetate--CoA ligase family protein [Sulfolobales archaeon]MDW8170550.1 acetate--CoA ligase family protein [Desulfurococcaceae archaeon]